jgi:hypothetical protein
MRLNPRPQNILTKEGKTIADEVTNYDASHLPGIGSCVGKNP